MLRTSARGSQKSLMAILAVAFAFRLATALLYPVIQSNSGLSLGSDGYEKLAATLAAGHGYKFAPHLGESMFYPPVYPLFLALLILVAGPSLLVATVAQAAVDTVSCFMIYTLGRRHAGPQVAYWSALLYALYPGMWIGCARYVTEPLFVFLTLGFLVFFSRFMQTGHKCQVAIASVFGATAILCKSVAGALPLFLVVCVLLLPGWRGCRRRVLAGLVVCLCASGVMAAPWIYHNYRVSGSFVCPSSSGGLALYAAHIYAANPDQQIRKSANQAAAEVRQLAVDNGIRLDPGDTYPRWFYDPKDEVKLSKIAQDVARTRILADPRGFARHVAGNLWRFWWGAPTRKSIVIAILVNTPIMVLGGIGIFLSRAWRHADLSLCLAVAAYLFLAHVGILAVVRYSLTVAPIVCLFGGVTAARWLNRSGSE